MNILIGILIAMGIAIWLGGLFEGKNGKDALICGAVFGSIFLIIIIHMFMSTPH